MTRYRKLAAEFYYKPNGITGVVQRWMDGGAADGVDADCVELAAYLEERFGPHLPVEDWGRHLALMADPNGPWVQDPTGRSAIREALAEIAALRDARDEFRSRLVEAERSAREWEGNVEAAEARAIEAEADLAAARRLLEGAGADFDAEIAYLRGKGPDPDPKSRRLAEAVSMLRECVGDINTPGLYETGRFVERHGIQVARTAVERAANLERRIRAWLKGAT